MTDVRSGESDAISKDGPIDRFCCMLIEVLSEDLTVEVTPSLMTMPAPMLPVDAGVSPEIFLK
jgi:hypothetical protein